MPTAPLAPHATVSIALIGNPNTGKSTLFSALAGIHQKTGNYPGVTVEKKVGHTTHDGRRWALVDLPGTYSLAPRSPDEMVAVDVLTGRQHDVRPVDVALCIVDAGNLERNLYLVSQVLEIGLPTVVALNMIDVARSRGLTIDVAKLSHQLGVPVIAVQANRRVGLDDLKSALAKAIDGTARPPESPFPPAFVEEVDRLEATIATDGLAPLPRYLVERLLLDTSGYVEGRLVTDPTGQVRDALKCGRERLAASGLPVPAVEAMARYGWVGRVLEGVVTRPDTRTVTMADRLDRVLTHRLWGTIAFILVMLFMFQAMFSWSKPFMESIGEAVGWLGDRVGPMMAEGPLRELVVDGIIGGVGSVITFLPQIFFLFLFIAILEDCGYMARAAYLMDRIMVRFGLSGKSFIPLLSSFACAIPGVMATRVIENRRDRFTTILIAPLMSCSARLPVYALMIAAFVPSRPVGLQGFTMFAMYLVGMVTAAIVALILKKTFFKGAPPPFVMELPAYKWPSPRIVLHRMFSQSFGFIRRAGTLILAISVVVWGASYFPHHTEQIEAPYRQELAALEAVRARNPEAEAQIQQIQDRIDGEYKRQSYLGRAGRWIEPAIKPLGWDWRIGCAAIASFPAREVVVSTLGVLFDAGKANGEENAGNRLRAALKSARWPETGKPLFNVPVALSLMVFFALCAQCAATLAVIGRETQSWRWPAFTFAYMTILAYLAALVTYQVGMLFSR